MAETNKNIKDRVYQTLKERLINCEYTPGSFLNEAQLAADLGCSRTPIREAISRLERDNFVEVVPKKGIYVTTMTLNDVQQIFQTRLQIEPLTVRMSINNLDADLLYMFRQKLCEDTTDIKNAFRLDTAMHLCIIEHCGNRYIIDMMNKLFQDNTRVIISSKQNQVHIHESRSEHVGIIDAILERDADKAAERMRNHILSCREAAFNYFYNNQSTISSEKDSYLSILDKYTNS